MAESNLVFEHGKGQDEALGITKNILGDAERQHKKEISELNQKWDGNKCIFSFKATAKGIPVTISGTLTVKKNVLELYVKYSDAAVLFRKDVESILMEVAKKAFSK